MKAASGANKEGVAVEQGHGRAWPGGRGRAQAHKGGVRQGWHPALSSRSVRRLPHQAQGVPRPELLPPLAVRSLFLSHIYIHSLPLNLLVPSLFLSPLEQLRA